MSQEPPPATPEGESPPGDGDAGSPAPAEPEAEGDSRVSYWVKLIGGILGAALAAATLYFLVFPRSPGCGGERSGSLGEATVDRGVSYRDFLRRTNQQDQGADEATLARKGTMIHVPITAVGYADKALPLRWTVLTSSGGLLPEEDMTDQLALGFVPEDCSETGQRQVWVPWPERDGTYVVELTLFEDDGEDVLSTLRTDAFAVPVP